MVVAPTLTAVEMHPGAPMPFTNPELPAEMTVTMLLVRSVSMIGLRVSVSQAAAKPPPPRLMFTEAIV